MVEEKQEGAYFAPPPPGKIRLKHHLYIFGESHEGSRKNHFSFLSYSPKTIRGRGGMPPSSNKVKQEDLWSRGGGSQQEDFH